MLARRRPNTLIFMGTKQACNWADKLITGGYITFNQDLDGLQRS